MKSAIYLRVSTDEQRERQSIATQHDFAERYCALHEISIAGFYADDGVSGTVPVEGRQEGKRMLEDARSRKFEQVLVYKLDRLGREPRLILNAVKELEDLGVVVKCMTEPFETSTAAGRFLLTILSGVAGLERDNIIQRSAEGIGRLVREGAWVGGVAPYGYRVEGRRREARLVVSDVPVPGMGMTESDVVRLIFRMAGDEGKSCFAIAEHLNQLGVPPSVPRDGAEPPRGKRQRFTSGRWRDSRVQYILTSPTYKGVHIYGKRPKNKRRAPVCVQRRVPAIVDDELWARTQLALKRNRLFCKRNAHREYLLRGLAKCAHCGRTYIGTVYSGESRPTRKYYVCGGRHKGRRSAPDPSNRCQGMAIAGDIEDVIWADVESYLRNPGSVLEQLATRLRASDGASATVKSRLGALKVSLAAKDSERTRVIGLFRRGRIDDAALDQQLEEVDGERAQLQIEIVQLERASDRAHELEAELLTLTGVLAAINRRLEEPPSEELKRQLIEKLVAGIEVETIGHGDERESQVTVTYRFDAPGDSIDPCSPRGIRVLQTLALPLGYAASTSCRAETYSALRMGTPVRAKREGARPEGANSWPAAADRARRGTQSAPSRGPQAERLPLPPTCACGAAVACAAPPTREPRARATSPRTRSLRPPRLQGRGPPRRSARPAC